MGCGKRRAKIVGCGEGRAKIVGCGEIKKKVGFSIFFGVSLINEYQNILHEHISKIISTKALLHPI